MTHYEPRELVVHASRVNRLAVLVVFICTLVGVASGVVVGFAIEPILSRALVPQGIKVKPPAFAMIGAIGVGLLGWSLAVYLTAAIRLFSQIGLALAQIEVNTRPASGNARYG